MRDERRPIVESYKEFPKDSWERDVLAWAETIQAHRGPVPYTVVSVMPMSAATVHVCVRWGR